MFTIDFSFAEMSHIWFCGILVVDSEPFPRRDRSRHCTHSVIFCLSSLASLSRRSIYFLRRHAFHIAECHILIQIIQQPTILHTISGIAKDGQIMSVPTPCLKRQLSFASRRHCTWHLPIIFPIHNFPQTVPIAFSGLETPRLTYMLDGHRLPTSRRREHYPCTYRIRGFCTPTTSDTLSGCSSSAPKITQFKTLHLLNNRNCNASSHADPQIQKRASCVPRVTRQLKPVERASSFLQCDVKSSCD